LGNHDAVLTLAARGFGFVRKHQAAVATVLYAAGLILPCVKGPDGNTYSGCGMTLGVMGQTWRGFVMLFVAHGAAIVGLARVWGVMPSTPATARLALVGVILCFGIATYWWINFPWPLYVGFYAWIAAIAALLFALWREQRAASSGAGAIALGGLWAGLKRPLQEHGAAQGDGAATAPTRFPRILPLTAAIGPPVLALVAIYYVANASRGVGTQSASSPPLAFADNASDRLGSDTDLLAGSGPDDPDGTKRLARLRRVANGEIAASDFVRGRAQAVVRMADKAARHSTPSESEAIPSPGIASPDVGIFTDEEWQAITDSLVREGRVNRSRPQDAAKYFRLYALIKRVLMDSGMPNPSTRMLNSFKSQVCEATITARGPDAAADHLATLVLAAKQSGIPIVSPESVAKLEAGESRVTPQRGEGLATGGNAVTPQRLQQFEGTCTKCGYRTGLQVSQTQRTCIQLGVGVDGSRPCGGVIVWDPAQGY